ncbi:hypothetical protein D3C81_1628790 [compost metagenome]
MEESPTDFRHVGQQALGMCMALFKFTAVAPQASLLQAIVHQPQATARQVRRVALPGAQPLHARAPQTHAIAVCRIIGGKYPMAYIALKNGKCTLQITQLLRMLACNTFRAYQHVEQTPASHGQQGKQGQRQ